ncbi:cell division inhibitor SepF [Clostridium sp. USBA 49]|jgi:cell division inhibitor SepF|uniref:cell division protein SepF n=1 Tax=Clostridium TaxID=1485 RepID=UPI000999FF23|nr:MULTISPECIES: cell division protein SepF [Clostridium]SKA76974.1 cell division inhibitor SepF [Clostridium sp. USBA 49]
MCAKMINKMMGFLGLEEDLDIEENQEQEDEKELIDDEVEKMFINNKKQNTNKVVNIHTAASAKVVIIKPNDYDEAANICDNLKNRKIIVVNTTSLEPKIAQRLLDFIGGACYALNGELQQVEKGIYILSPSNVEVTNELKNELSSKGILSWSK